jgi:hypothetical protein
VNESGGFRLEFFSAKTMVYKHISKDLKERALWLLEHNYIPSDVSKKNGVSVGFHIPP